MGQSNHAVHRGEALCIKQHQLTPMAEDHLQARHAIEHNREDKTKELDPAS